MATKKKIAKTPAKSNKNTKPTKKPVSKSKPLAKKSPVKKQAPKKAVTKSKPVAKKSGTKKAIKPTVKKTVAKTKPVAKSKSTAKKPAIKSKVVAKKPVTKTKPITKKPLAKAKPAKKIIAKAKTASKKPEIKKPSKTPIKKQVKEDTKKGEKQILKKPLVLEKKQEVIVKKEKEKSARRDRNRRKKKKGGEGDSDEPKLDDLDPLVEEIIASTKKRNQPKEKKAPSPIKLMPTVKIETAIKEHVIPKNFRNGGKEKFVMEFGAKTSPRILFNFISSPSGLSEWFADNVNIKNGVYTFFWDESEEQATLLVAREFELIRFKWLNTSEDDTYFELNIQIDELTGDVALIITDFAKKEELQESQLLWEAQIHDLFKALGS